MFVSQARTGEAFTPFIDWALRHRLRWRHRRERARRAGIHRHCWSTLPSISIRLGVHSQHTNTQTVTPSTRHSHLAHITPASFKCSQTCDAYRAHRHWVFTAQIVRIFIAPKISTIFIALQMNSVFLWSICLFTQCIRNQHFRIFYFVKRWLQNRRTSFES